MPRSDSPQPHWQNMNALLCWVRRSHTEHRDPQVPQLMTHLCDINASGQGDSASATARCWRAMSLPRGVEESVNARVLDLYENCLPM